MRPSLLIAAVAATILSGAAIAGQLPPRPAPAETLTRADALARADQRFALIDTDHDGRITAAERGAMPSRGPRPAPPADGGRRGWGGGGMGGQRGLERADADRDGIVTRAEFAAQAGAAFDRQDLDRNGKVDAAERERLREQRMERRGERADD